VQRLAGWEVDLVAQVDLLPPAPHQNYTYDGEKLMTRVDAASDPSRIGSDQVRGVRFENEQMVLIPPPRRAGETEEHRKIMRERIAAE
jgi:hypothetical protein